MQEMRLHLNLPPGRNIFDPIAVEDSSSEDNNE